MISINSRELVIKRSQVLHRVLPLLADAGKSMTARNLLAFVQDTTDLPADFATQFFTDTQYDCFFDPHTPTVLQKVRGLGLLVLFIELMHRLGSVITQNEFILDVIDKAYDEKKKYPNLSIFEVINSMQKFPELPFTLSIPTFANVLDDVAIAALPIEQFSKFADSYAYYIQEQLTNDGCIIVRVFEDSYFDHAKKTGGTCFIAFLGMRKNTLGIWIAEVFEGYNGVVSVTLESVIRSLAVFVGGRHVGTGLLKRK